MTDQQRPDICGDVLHAGPGQPDICRRPTGHHGAHVARPHDPTSPWWTAQPEPPTMVVDHPQPMVIYPDPDTSTLGFRR